VKSGRFTVPTLAEAIELIQGLNRSTGRVAGIYVEIKYAGFHQAAGRDIAATVLDLLHHYGYREPADPCIIQSFDPGILRRIRPRTRLRLVQLIGENRWGVSDADFNAMRTPEGLAGVAAYADGIGPHYRQVITGISADGRAEMTPLLPAARRLGLMVHPYTLRADDLPPWASDFDALLSAFFTQAKVGGVFTDFPDQAVRFLRQNPMDSR
jgi:glycerophosphoryl diester phosphodiesterase